LTAGVAEIGFARRGGITRLVHLYQRDPLRVLLPLPEKDDPPLAVIVTTSGGLVAGDRLDIGISVGAAAAAHVTAAAAEKIYRSTGQTTIISQSLELGPGAALEFLPPETILFDGARLRRETRIELAPGAMFLGGDIVVFGRRARGERFRAGLLREVWEVNRNGKLVWGDALHLEDEIGPTIDDPACFDAAAAFATMIFVPPGTNPRALLDSGRDVQSAGAMPGICGGLTAVAGLLVARWLAAEPATLRRAFADLACHFRASALGLPPRLPRIWHV
jgi:urease accessory protein